MQSLGSQLQSLQAQIAGLQGGGGGGVAPSQAYNPVQIPQFKQAVAHPPASVTTAFGGMSEIQAIRPAPLSTIEEGSGAGGAAPKKSYLWVVVLVVLLILVATGVAVYFIRRAARNKQEAEDGHLRALALEMESRQTEERQVEESRQAAAMAQQQQAQQAAAAAEHAARQRRANEEMAQQVSASLLSRAQPGLTAAVPATAPRFVPFPDSAAPVVAAPVVPVVAAPVVPVVAAPVVPVPTDRRLQEGNEYLTRAITNVTSSIRAGLQQAILAQKSFSPEPQRDASLLYNQGELGLKVTGTETFALHKEVLEGVAAGHPTGEVPVTGQPPAVAPDTAAATLPDL